MLWYSFLTQQEALQEITPHVSALAQRLTKDGIKVVAFYVDKCCHYRKQLLEVRPLDL